MTNEAEERARFETYAVQERLVGQLIGLERDGDGYKAEAVDRAWQIWKAARAASPVSAPTETHEQLRMRKCLPMIPELQKTARLCGYALLVHGSLKRDIDLVAVPWTEEAVTAEQLAESIRQRAAELNNAKVAFVAPQDEHEMPRKKPHGRLAWAFHLGGGPYLDLSVIQPAVAPVSAEQPTKCSLCGSEDRAIRLCEIPWAGGQAHEPIEGEDCILCSSDWHESAPSVASEDSATQPTIIWQKDLRNEATSAPILNAANPASQVVVGSNEVSYVVKLLGEQDAIRPDGSATGSGSPSEASTVEPPATGLTPGSEDWMRKAAALEAILCRVRKIAIERLSLGDRNAILTAADSSAASQLSTEKK